MDLEPDSKESLNVGLDPQKTLDFALFQCANDQLMNPTESHASMSRLLDRMEVAWGSDELKKLPPLDIIIYKDLVPRGWSWDRLLPWMSGSVLFEDYFNYLEEYFFIKYGDFSASLNLHAAATECIEAEKQLTTSLTRHAASVTGHPDLHNISTKITHEAQQITDSNPESRSIVQFPVQAACFRCIAEEAKLMSGLAQCISTPDKSMAELWQWKFEFSMKVRKAAFHILTTYKGPYFRQVSASMLGMKKEATIACELLNIDVKDCEDKMHNSEVVRSGLLDLLYIIQNHFPPETSINYYPIDSAYTAMASKERWFRLLESSKESRSPDVPFPVNSDGNVKTPVTPKSAASATTLRCSASFSSDDESGKDIKTSRKRKSMIGTQDSETPIMQLSERWKDDETTDPLGSQVTTDGEPRNEIRSAAGGYPTNSCTATPLSCSASSVSAEESGKDDKKRKSMGGTKDSEMYTTQSSEPSKDDGTLDLFDSQITSDGAPLTPITGSGVASLQTCDTAMRNSDHEK